MKTLHLVLSDEEYDQLHAALNNAIIALSGVYFAGMYGCEVPSAFEPLFKDKTFDERDVLCNSRMRSLRNLYDVITLTKDMKET